MPAGLLPSPGGTALRWMDVVGARSLGGGRRCAGRSRVSGSSRSAVRRLGSRPVDEIPAPFAPFEHMVGAWKGTASPVANRVKGWPESHAWAWKFDNGKPVAMTVDWQGDKTLTKGQLNYDAAEKKYRLDGTDPAGKPVAFVGSMSADGKIVDPRQGRRQPGRTPGADHRPPEREQDSLHPAGRPPGTGRPPVQEADRGRSDQGGRVVRRRLGRGRPPQVHHDRRRLDHDGQLPGEDLSRLLHRLPR